MRETITLNYIKGGRHFKGVIPRYELQTKMNDFVLNYPNCNQNASKLTKLIPRIVMITINQDILGTCDVPFFVFSTADSTTVDILKLHRPCTYVWKTFEEYCKKIQNA